MENYPQNSHSILCSWNTRGSVDGAVRFHIFC